MAKNKSAKSKNTSLIYFLETMDPKVRTIIVFCFIVILGFVAVEIADPDLSTITGYGSKQGKLDPMPVIDEPYVVGTGEIAFTFKVGDNAVILPSSVRIKNKATGQEYTAGENYIVFPSGDPQHGIVAPAVGRLSELKDPLPAGAEVLVSYNFLPRS